MQSGVVYALLAFGSWGLFPLYWKMLGHVRPWDIVAHRMLWSAVFLTGLLFLRRRMAQIAMFVEIVKIFRSRKIFLTVLLAALLISINWTVYIYAVTSHRVLDASLGYFINPLINVLLGICFLKERLNRTDRWAVVCALIGVLVQTWERGQFPWLGLVLAVTFGVYGLIRKRLGISGWVLAAVETWMMFLPAVAWTAFAPRVLHGGEPLAALDMRTCILLVLGGVVTALPIVWFTEAARRLKLTTLGFFQFLTPSLLFLVAVFILRERCSMWRWVSFFWIWLGVGVFLQSRAHQRRR